MTRSPIALALSAALAALVLAACGGGGGSTEAASAPADPEEPATGTLRVFTYEDTVAPDLMKPFEEQNPDLEVKTASFGSDSEAAAKLVGWLPGRRGRVLPRRDAAAAARQLLAPIDTAGVPEWDNLAFTDAPGVQSEGKVWVVPLSAGPQGLIVNTEKVTEPPDSWQALFDPQYKGEVAIEGDYELPAIAEAALAIGIEDPMAMDEAELAEATDYLKEHHGQFRALWESDSDLVNLFKSGEVVISDGGPGIAQRMIEDGVPVEWIAPKEGPLSWVCGLSITSKAQNVDAAYRLINWQASPQAQAIRADDGYVRHQPEGDVAGLGGSEAHRRPGEHRRRDPRDAAPDRGRMGPRLPGIPVGMKRARRRHA